MVEAYGRVPRARAQTDAVVAGAEAADAVLVAAEGADAFAAQDVPDLRIDVS